MIIFKNIIAEGLGSIINRTEYKLDHTGITNIIGKNGAGKTTIFNVLSWVLYKKLLKNGSSLEPWPHIQPSDFSGCYGEINFSKDGVDYQIIRVQDYKKKVLDKKRKNSLIIIENGKELPLRDKDDNQKKVIEILGYSFDLFKSTILFGQELKRMMGEDGATKKKILEETFDASFINKAKDLVIKKNTPLKEERYKLEQNILAKEQILSNLRDLVKSIREQKKTYKEDRKNKIKEQRKLYISIQSNMVDAPKNYSEKLLELSNEELRLRKSMDNSLSNQEFKKNLEMNNKYDELQKVEKNLEVLREKFTNQNLKCSQCGNELSPEQKEKVISSLKKEYTQLKTKYFHIEIEAKNLKKEYEKIQEEVNKNEEVYKQIKELDIELNKYRSLQKVYDEAIEHNKDLKRELNRIEDKIDNIKKTKLTNSTKELIPKIKECKEEIGSKENDLKFLKKQISLNDWLINDPLSNSGLKSMIFDTMLGKINQKLKLYTKDIGFSIRVFIDLKSSHKNIEIAVLMAGNEVLYNDLSGGQKQLVDIVLAFANDDVVFENKPINILLLDEVFERLSNENLEIISNIIQQKAQYRCIHLITHQNTFSPLTSRQVFVQLDKKGYTKYSL